MKTTREITAAQDKANSSKIESIRRSAGGEMYRCPVCTRAVDTPYRRIVDGVVVEGCIDASHTESMSVGVGNSQAWHNRPQARKLRADGLKWLLAH